MQHFITPVTGQGSELHHNTYIHTFPQTLPDSCTARPVGNEFEHISVQHFRTALPLVKALGVPFYVHAELPHEVPASEVTHLCPALSSDPKRRLAACRPCEVYTPAGLPHDMPAP